MKLETITGQFVVRFQYFEEPYRYGFANATCRGVRCELTGGRGGVMTRAVCDSRALFVKAIGRKLAFAKAMQMLYLPRHIRAELWFRYLKTLKNGRVMAYDGVKRFAEHAVRRGEPVGFLVAPVTLEDGRFIVRAPLA